MRENEAEKIVNAYGQTIANRQSPFQKISSLPYPKVKIKAAFFVYINAIINQYGYLPEDIGHSLTTTYAMLESFMDDDEAIRLASVWDAIQNKELVADSEENKNIITSTLQLLSEVTMDGKLFDEINSYIAGCLPE